MSRKWLRTRQRGGLRLTPFYLTIIEYWLIEAFNSQLEGAVLEKEIIEVIRSSAKSPTLTDAGLRIVVEEMCKFHALLNKLEP